VLRASDFSKTQVDELVQRKGATEFPQVLRDGARGSLPSCELSRSADEIAQIIFFPRESTGRKTKFGQDGQMTFERS
jgi:hypothetical protein